MDSAFSDLRGAGKSVVGSRSSSRDELEEVAGGPRVSDSLDLVNSSRSVSRVGVSGGGSRDRSMAGLRMGDMVWGKVKSHPWWPGVLYNEAFALPEVRNVPHEPGQVLVAFYGDNSYGWFDSSELLPFGAGLREKASARASGNFLKAIQEALEEVVKRGALGVACRCRYPDNFRPTHVPGFLYVDVAGYDSNAKISEAHLAEARARFQPANVLSYVQGLARDPKSFSLSTETLSMVGLVIGYRRARFEEKDDTYIEAFGAFRLEVEQERLARVAAEGASAVKKSASTSFVGKSHKKKNKYELKRREDVGAGSVRSSLATALAIRQAELPDLPSAVDFYDTVTDKHQERPVPDSDMPPGFSVVQESAVTAPQLKVENRPAGKTTTKKLAKTTKRARAQAGPSGEAEGKERVKKVKTIPRQPPRLDLPQVFKKGSSGATSTSSSEKKEAVAAVPTRPPPPPKKPAARADDAAQASRKHGLSDRPEDVNTKRKVTVQPQSGSGSGGSSSAQAMGTQPPSRPTNRTEQLGKEPAHAIKAPSPTTLAMRFPYGMTLPSVALLKARFARFGPLHVDGTRVFWKSSTCKVIYKFRNDAEAALNYAKNNNMFGNAKVTFSLSEVKKDEPTEQAPAAVLQSSDAWSTEASSVSSMRAAVVGSSVVASAAGSSRLSSSAPARPMQPKSILKRAAEEGGQGAPAREAPRVKFVLDGSDAAADLPVITSAQAPRDSMPGRVAPVLVPAPSLAPPALSSPALDHPGFAAQTATPQNGNRAPPPALTSQPRATRGIDPRLGLLVPLNGQRATQPPTITMPTIVPSSHPVLPASARPPPAIGPNGQGSTQPTACRSAAGMAAGEEGMTDAGARMLQLLIQCKQVVEHVRDSLGYMPYHMI